MVVSRLAGGALPSSRRPAITGGSSQVVAHIGEGDLSRIEVLEGDIRRLHPFSNTSASGSSHRGFGLKAKVLRERYISCSHLFPSQVLFPTARFTLEL
ncbi:MAG: hypothetical protein CM15mP77_1180 [Synechococcus sp.]|nr:MAG: hypothetical protein CM15mP77_1180 [Synechococcus sp.]